MPIKLELKEQIQKDLLADSMQEKAQTPKKVKSTNNKKMGRPKGVNCISRTLRVPEELNNRLVKYHEESQLSYHDIINNALREYLTKMNY